MTKLYSPLINGQKGGDQRRLVLDLQTDGTWLILGVDDPANPGQDAMTLSGLALSTAGVSDSADKRFVTDAELGNLVILGPLALLEAQLAKVGARTGADSLLASVASVDMNTATPTPLYTVPAGKTCIVTKIFIRNCSGSLTTASISFGFTTPTFADVVADHTHVELADNTTFSLLPAKTGALAGVAAAVLNCLCNTQQGAPMTISVDVFGYLF